MARPKKSAATTLELISSAFPPEPQPTAHPTEQFMRDLALHPNPGAANEILKRHYEEVWMADHAQELQVLAGQIDVLTGAVKLKRDLMQKLEEQLLETQEILEKETPSHKK